MPAASAPTLKITQIPLITGAVIGIVPCPGRHQAEGRDRRGHRDTEVDFKVLETWGAKILISLVEDREFTSLGVPDFKAMACAREFAWYHLPIADMGVPGEAFSKSWAVCGPDILRALQHGERIIVHCAGGLGRSGMIAAKLMTAFGVAADDAMAQVRKLRPGAIETREQEHYVLNGRDLMQSLL